MNKSEIPAGAEEIKLSKVELKARQAARELRAARTTSDVAKAIEKGEQTIMDEELIDEANQLTAEKIIEDEDDRQINR